VPRTNPDTPRGSWSAPAWTSHATRSHLRRGLAILRCLTPERPVLGIADISADLGMSRSTTHRYVITLVGLGYLEQGSSRKYCLGCLSDALSTQATPRARGGHKTAATPLRGRGSQHMQMTERAGFEPAMEFNPHTRLAGECLQPLGHLSLGSLGGQCKGCAVPARKARRAFCSCSVAPLPDSRGRSICWPRKGGRAVECTGLENQTSRKSHPLPVLGLLAFLSRFPHR
jgi:IclR helix-turn-helix domain